MLFFLLMANAGCSALGTIAQDRAGDPVLSNAPEWVVKGTGRFLDDQQRGQFHGVGMVSGIKNTALARATADNRARAEVMSYLEKHLQLPQGTSWSAQESRLARSLQIVDHWISPTGEFYALANLSEEQALAVAPGASLPPFSAAEQRASAPAVRPAEVKEPGPASPRPAQKPIVAVFDIELRRLTFEQQFVEGLTDYMAMRLAESGKFQVIPRSALKERLVESKSASYQSCYEQSCQIELGRELAAEKTIATQIAKLGSQCSVSIALYDLKKATTEVAATTSGGCSEDGLASSINTVVDKLTQR